MKVDPVVTFWISLATTIAQGIASGTVHLTGLIPPAYIPVVTGWLGLVVFINMSFLTALTATSSAKPGPLAAPPTIPEANAVMDAAKKAAQ
jgi:hypothetical protein